MRFVQASGAGLPEPSEFVVASFEVVSAQRVDPVGIGRLDVGSIQDRVTHAFGWNPVDPVHNGDLRSSVDADRQKQG